MQGFLSFSSSVHQCGVQRGLLFPGVEGALNAGQLLPRGAVVVGRQQSWQHTLLLRQWKLLNDEMRWRCGFAARQVVSCSSGHDGPDFSCPLVPRIERRRHRRPVVSWATSTSTLLPTVKEESSKLELVEPDFYRMGYIRHVRAYGVVFKEGPEGIGVYSAKNIPCLEKPRVIMEIPMELMVTVSKDLPWMFHPDIVPLGHPIFDVINSTNVETDWDIRLACLLLLALDQNDNFWQLYGDYLPGDDEITNLLLASEEELHELQDASLARDLAEQQQRSDTAWCTYWPADAVLKLKRLARDPGRLRWALGVAWSRSFTMTMTIGAKIQDAHMLIPYADMINHSFEPTCSYRWRKRDRMLEVVINAGQTIQEGDEMTFNYMEKAPNSKYMQMYGFSSAINPWDSVMFSGNARIHLDSFLSAFNIGGMPDEYYYNEAAAEEVDTFVDGAVLAAARMLPSWKDKDLPFRPSMEMHAARELQNECRQFLSAYPTTLDEDFRIIGALPLTHGYRMDRKLLVKKIIDSLDVYMERMLY
ncbi:unnamed protein product [Sphagnum compactum]